MKKFFIFIFLVSAVHAAYFNNAELIPSHHFTYSDGFFFVENEKKLIWIRDPIQPEPQVVYEFPDQNTVIKYFPMAEGYNMIARTGKNKREVLLLVLEPSGRVFLRKTINTDYEILDFDLRFDKGMKLVGLIYGKKENSYSLFLWSESGEEEIVKSEKPVSAYFLQWQKNLVHFVTTGDNGTEWIVWKKGKYERSRHNRILRGTQFFIWKGDVFLVGAEGNGTLLYLLNTGNRELQAEKLGSNPYYSHAREIIPKTNGENLALYITAAGVDRIYRITFSNFKKGYTEGPVEERTFFTGSQKMIPLYVNGQSNILFETRNRQVYIEPFVPDLLSLTSVNWKVTGGAKPMLEIFWNAPGKDIAVAYLLDHKTEGKPLDEYRINKDKIISMANLENGHYTLHLKLKDNATGKISPLYHVSVFWKYKPALPSVLLLNTVAERMVSQNEFSFEILNHEESDYFYEINQIPVYNNPERPLQRTGAEATINDRLKPGRHYLHLRSRDRHSGVDSDVLHYLFFVYPYNPEADPLLSDLQKSQGEKQFILNKIKASKTREERKEWLEKLKKLKQAETTQ